MTQTNAPTSLLVISTEQHLSESQRISLNAAIEPIGKQLGMLVAVMDGGLKAHLHRDLTPLIEVLHAQTLAIGQLAQQCAAMLEAMQPEEEEEPVGYLSNKTR